MTKFRMNYLEYLFLFFIGLFTLFTVNRSEKMISNLVDRVEELKLKVEILEARP